MIFWRGIASRLDVGEVLQEQASHVRVKTLAVGHRRAGRSPRSGALAGATSDRLGQLPHDHAMTKIPGNPWELTGTIGESCTEPGDGTGHCCSPCNTSSRSLT